jgi:hypothetical protein
MPVHLKLLLTHLKPADYVIAAMPSSTLFVLSWQSINGALTFISGCIGLAFLIWKWRREAKKKDSNPPLEE